MTERLQIKTDLLKQLEEKGMKHQHYISLVDDYLKLWDVKNLLFSDIKKRGVSVPYDHGGGQSGAKKNDSVAEVNKVSASMLKILNELGLRGANIKAVEPDAEM